jgi:hypothetical protein
MLPCDLPERAFDTVLASEIIEHLPPDQVDRFLESLQRTARTRVIITTPNFSCIRGGSDSPLGHNPLDAHLGYVSIQYLKERGFAVHGAGFGNRTYLRTRIFVKLVRIFGCKNPTVWFSGFSYYWPRLGTCIVAYRDSQ